MIQAPKLSSAMCQTNVTSKSCFYKRTTIQTSYERIAAQSRLLAISWRSIEILNTSVTERSLSPERFIFILFASDSCACIKLIDHFDFDNCPKLSQLHSLKKNNNFIRKPQINLIILPRICAFGIMYFPPSSPRPVFQSSSRYINMW